MITTAEFRNGSRLLDRRRSVLYRRVSTRQTGQAEPSVTKLKSYITGNVLDRTFRSGERFEEPDLEERDMQFLYATGDSLLIHGHRDL